MKKLYIIPGLGETTRMKNYRQIIKSAKNNGYEIVSVNINWDATKDMTDFIKEADNKLPTNLSNDIILGFSFGSYIAYQLSKNRKTKGYIFCSTSPYFLADLKQIPKVTRDYFGPKLFNSFKKYKKIQNLPTSAFFLIGSEDWPLAIQRTKDLYESWEGLKELQIIPNVEHDLCDKNYSDKVISIINYYQL